MLFLPLKKSYNLVGELGMGVISASVCAVMGTQAVGHTLHG